jgi:transposase
MSMTVEYAAYIGVDWADKENAISLQEAGSNEVEARVVSQKPEDLHRWLLSLRDRFAGRRVALAVEQSKGAFIHAVLTYEFVDVFRIPPKSLARYREAFASSGAKDDPTDATLLLDWVKLHRDKVKAWVPDVPEIRELAQLVEFRRTIIGERIRLTNMLGDALKGYFPQALSWAGELSTVMACDFLTKWPTLTAVRKTTPAQLRKFYQQHGCRRSELLERRIEETRTARALTDDPAVLEASVIVIQTIVPLLRCLLERISIIEGHIKKLFERQQDHELFKSFPGAGENTAPRLLVGLGSDRSRFNSAVEVQQFSGIAPVTEKSGKSCWVHHRFKCPKFLKQTFHEYAGLSVRASVWARAFYDMQRARGKGHHAAVRALAYKWIRVIYRCWKDRVAYDEALYLAKLRARGSALSEHVGALT